MIEVSPLNKRKYLYELRQQMGSWTDFGQERFSGLIIGNFFYITHHSQYEWDRRYHNPKCRALGFVTNAGEETQIWAMCTYGEIDPISLLKWFPVFFLTCLTAASTVPISHLILLAVALDILCCTFNAIGTWFTSRGRDNMFELRALIENPKRFWADAEEDTQ